MFVSRTRYTSGYVRCISENTSSTDDLSVFWCTKMAKARLIDTYGVWCASYFSPFSTILEQREREQTDKYFSFLVLMYEKGKMVVMPFPFLPLHLTLTSIIEKKSFQGIKRTLIALCVLEREAHMPSVIALESSYYFQTEVSMHLYTQ